ncbi:hypothetical protein Dimus_014348 [Dionaea muscipula]
MQFHGSFLHYFCLCPQSIYYIIYIYIYTISQHQHQHQHQHAYIYIFQVNILIPLYIFFFLYLIMGTECLPNPSTWFCAKAPKLKSSKSPKPSSPTTTSSNSSPPRDRSNFASSRKAVGRPRSRKDELKEVFRYFDTDNDGKISAYELRSFFGSIGEHMSQEDAQGVIDDLNSDGDRMLSFHDFVRLVTIGKVAAGGDHRDELKKVFEMFEYEKGSGRITPKGLQRMLSRLGDSKSHDECVAMIKIYDIDGDGALDFNEFHQMMS